jgi:23S rRNA pseudouridine1911/1915/1917 synthase
MKLREQILLETDKYLVINKPAGLLSQPDKSQDPDVAMLLKAELGLSFLAPVHRLDRNTSGCLILAKNSKTAGQFAELLKGNKIHRVYYAVVKGNPPETGTIDVKLAKDEEKNQSFPSEDGKTAITHFKCLEAFGATALIEVILETGRSHQIRAHFAHIKCPLIGDRKYAKKPWSEIYGRPALHAIAIEFPDPDTKKTQKISCDLPDDFEKLIERLRG